MTLNSTFLVCLALSACALANGQESPRTSQFQVIYSFGLSDGSEPEGAPVLGASGEVYGFTRGGGAFFGGVVFELAPPAVQGGAWTETVLHSFGGTTADGSTPTGLVLGAGGRLFGVTQSGGTTSQGVVFELAPPAQNGGTWTESIIHTFGTAGDGADPLSLTHGGKGALYGTTAFGGALGNGAVFELTPPAVVGGAWSEQVIYSFPLQGYPYATLTLTTGHALLGTASGNDDPSVPSSAFALKPPQAPGAPWTEATLAEFGSDLADSPLLVEGSALIGSTFYGGAAGFGMIYKLTPPAAPQSPWTQTVLYSFPESNEGPQGKLVARKNGTLFGVTTGSGFSENGSVFALSPPVAPGGAWTYTLLHSLNGSTDGGSPQGGLSMGAKGSLFGFATTGGALGFGTVFEITGN